LKLTKYRYTKHNQPHIIITRGDDMKLDMSKVILQKRKEKQDHTAAIG
jgi:hypothetical protein